MGFLDDSLNVVKEAAFGDIKKVIGTAQDNLYSFMKRPIGLMVNSYNFMFEALNRNIGNVDYFYDGYGTPIGYYADPYLNLHYTTPWFFNDIAKQSSYNYIDYVKKTYGATISIQNINENYDFKIIGAETNVASIPTSVLLDISDRKDAIDFTFDIIGGSGFRYLSLNPNGTFNDTRLGQISAYYGSETLKNSIAVNTTREKTDAVTISLYYYYGLSELPIGNNLLSRFSKGKSASGINIMTDYMRSPVDEDFKGFSTETTYDDFISNLGKEQKEIYQNAINKRDEFRKNKGYTDPDYLCSNFIIKELDEKRYNLEINDNESFDYGGAIGIYNEDTESSNYKSANGGTRFSNFVKFEDGLDSSTLLYKTNEAFKNNEYKTLIGKYRGKLNNADKDEIQTAVSKNYGMSRGRNLLKSDANGSNYSTEYDNPYCRVWTYHHQYQNLSDTIRPFKKEGGIVSQGDLYSRYGFNGFSADNTAKGFKNGRERLGEHGVLNKTNGLVNISPVDEGDDNKRVDIKNCMFSIENLAWKDTITYKSSYNIQPLSPEQKGPFGGRIMWFPPYDLKFNEDVNVSWAETNFIGRGESIYTYKNTRRTGTLSFKLLIDHPSIINYWNNAEKPNDDTVDDVNSDEQKLLRFFAGCEFLTPGVSSVKKEEPGTKDEAVPTPNTEIYTFFVFFPNNYSGRDDTPDYAMDYLINGYGTWKVQFNDVVSDYKKTNEIVTAKNISYDNKIVGGYEIRPGISLDWPLKDASEKIYGTISTIKYGNTEDAIIVPMKQNGQDFEYFYRVDNDYLKTPLKNGGTNYLDITKESASLNSTKGNKFVQEQFKLEDNYALSFTDMYVSLKKGKTQEVLEGLYDSSKLQLITNKILNRKDKITEIICTGSASKPGNDNKTLANNRARVVKAWLSGLKLCDADKIKSDFTEETGGDDDVNSVSSKLYRHVRVDIKITAEESDTVQNIEREGYKNVEDGEVNNENKIVKGSENKLDNKTEFTDYNANPNYRKGINATVTDLTLKYFGNNNNGLKFNSRLDEVDGYKTHGGSLIDFVNNAYESAINSTEGTPNDNQTYMNSPEKKDTTTEEMESRGGYNTNSDDGEPVENARYDGEAKFFKLLEINEPFLHHKISEKIKYFDPAFHSVSPEGFNARLTFLQQCCRQGPTAGSSDSYTANNTANNLSFGRPPVCILRIGDFFYTKIIIEGVTIDYSGSNGLQWDLNTEGIGVMPMMADVTIRFNFIGGSSLAGPISRLQNALSFNMYANTEVYDDRSELADFDGEGNIIKFAPFNPSA